MACKNDQCKVQMWCEEKTSESVDPSTCETARLICSWWKAKISGIRDADEDFSEDDFD